MLTQHCLLRVQLITSELSYPLSPTAAQQQPPSGDRYGPLRQQDVAHGRRGSCAPGMLAGSDPPNWTWLNLAKSDYVGSDVLVDLRSVLAQHQRSNADITVLSHTAAADEFGGKASGVACATGARSWNTRWCIRGTENTG
jgi:hypothetical protein